MKSLLNAERINPGFDAKRNLLIVHVACISNPANSYNEFFLPAIDSLLSIPGVKRASFAKQMLLSGSGDGASCEVDIPGATLPKGQKNFSIRCNSVGRNYFETVGSLIFRGRAFDNNDELPDHRTIIVNETMAERFWPNADPIGKNVSIRGKDYQIVGIAQANRIQSIHEEPEPYLYIPFSQEPGNDGEVLIETMNDPMSIAGAARNKILSVDKSAFIQNPITLKSIMRQALYEERLLAFLALSLGILGALLSAVGLYAVVARLAEKRTREIGIRVALGAMNKDISRLVIREGYRISLVGIGIGLVASFFIARLLRDALYGVAPADPISYIVGSAVVLTISLAASYVPARKAIKADPMIALRNE
jgi:predicted permease